MKLRPVIALCGLLVACGGKKPVEEVAKPPTPPQLTVDGNARLREDVVPTSYRVHLSVDPAKETFSGKTEIDVEVKAPTQSIMLHAEDLTFSEAVVASGETQRTADVQTGPNGGLGLAFVEPVPPGAYTLRFTYEAPLDEVPTGLYRVKDGEHWYAFTQFEPLEARQAFPSFDEPRFKTPYTVTIKAPSGQLALANTPETGREEGDGGVTFTFAESKPLPTYLVAFAVGPFDVADGGEIDGVPFRLVATKGKAGLGGFVLENTPVILQTLTKYFGSPYPYEKLDVIAVPNFSAGAMENVGLVTFRESLLLLDPKQASVQEKRSALSVMAHELAHMWFGNLVTLPWWDELWLNEGFATWMAAKVLHEVMPELESDIDRVRSVGWVMHADSRAEARPIRQPIEHGGDVYNAFGAIAYGKGAAVLRLFEAWLSPGTMRAGIQAYLQKHVHGTGTTASLLEALGKASEKPVAEAMATFIDQPGAPLLTFEKACGEKTTLKVQQARYTPAGSTAQQTGPWSVPVCVEWPEGRETKSLCTLVTKASDQIELPPAAKCPAWYYPNAGQVGYYRWMTDADNFDRLLNNKTFQKFDVATKVEIFSNLDALSRADVVKPDRFLGAVRDLSSEKHRTLVSLFVSNLFSVEEAIPDERRADLQRVAKKLLAPHLRRVGYEPKGGEEIETSLLRPSVISAMAVVAEDKETIAWAKESAARFNKEMSKVPVETVQLALPIAAWDADASLWLSYSLAIDNAPTPATRVAVINALGSFREPQLLKRSLDLFLTDKLRSQDMWALIGPSFDDEKTFAVTWAWFKENFETIVAKIGNKAVPGLPRVGGGFCSAEGRKEVADFFADAARQKPGQEQNLANTLEDIDQCIRRRAYLQKGLDALLK